MHPRPAFHSAVRLACAVLLLPALAFLPGPLWAQTTVAGRIVDGDGAPVAFTNVQLRLQADSSLAKATISDTRGNFVIEGVGPGAYRIVASRLGYRSAASEVLTLAAGERLQAAPLVLQPEAVALEGVAVQASKPLYQQRSDRLIINIESSPTLAGASALQVLERSPGIVIDRASNAVSLIGKAGVRVLINGRPSYLPAEGLLQYLAGVGADNIERIELITSPPAHLDAEGNAGYINLVMKRSPDDGLNGSLAVSGGYGEGEMGDGSASLSYQRGRVGLFGNYSFLWDGRKQWISNYRRIAGADGVTEMPAASRRDRVQRNHNVRMGIDYRVNDGTTLGALAGAYDNRWSMTALNRLTITTNGNPITRIDSDNDEVNHWKHWMGNLNLRHELGGNGTLQADLDYLRYSNDNPTTYLDTSTDVASGRVTNEQIRSGKTTPLRIIVAKADYTTTQGKWELGTGVKGAFSRFTNRISLQAPVEREWLSEAGFGSKSSLREDVLAAYGSANFAPSEATTLKLGLRYELTDSNLGSEAERDIVDRRFGSLFPSIAFSHKLGENRQVDASYTRRITRPSFSDMAPFLYFFDPHTFFSGNAALQPAITNSVKLDGTYGSVLASLQYAWEDSTIAQFQSRFLPGYNIHVIFPTNFRGTKTASALLAAPVRLAPGWSTQNNAMLIRQTVNGFSSSAPVMMTSTSYRLNTTHTVSLPNDLSFEATGFYQSAALWGVMSFGSMFQVNLGVQRTQSNGAKLTVAVSDVFDSSDWEWMTGAPVDPLYIDTVIDFSHPTLTVTYSTRIGGGKEARNRSAASDEESGRVRR
jgi:hypothetical protein